MLFFFPNLTIEGSTTPPTLTPPSLSLQIDELKLYLEALKSNLGIQNCLLYSRRTDANLNSLYQLNFSQVTKEAFRIDTKIEQVVQAVLYTNAKMKEQVEAEL